MIVEKNSGENITVKVKNAVIGGENKVVISGPCSVEDYDTMMKIGENLKI